MERPGPSGRRVTMEDVAARAGVSRALVSIVFRDAPGASEATRRRVRAAADQLGYRPDQRARLLGRSRTRLLGVTYLVHASFHGDLVEALYAVAEPRGYDIALSAVSPSRHESRAIEALLDYRSEALLLLGPSMPASSLEELGRRIPTVVLARDPRVQAVASVRTDDSYGAGLAVAHLADLGHRDITHIDGRRAPGAAERRAGYRTRMRQLGLADSIRIVPGGLTEEDGARAAEGLLRGPRMPTALTVFNDRCALGVLLSLRDAGLRVPGDMSLVGYDDTRLAALTQIDLTTIRQDARAMAECAVDAATTLAEEEGALENGSAEHAVVPPTLVLRGTSGPPRT